MVAQRIKLLPATLASQGECYMLSFNPAPY